MQSKSRARSHAHSRRHGRLILHSVVGVCAVAAAFFAYQYPATTSASAPDTVAATSLPGITGLAGTHVDSVLRPGTSLMTNESVTVLTVKSDITSIRPSAAISPLSSFSAGVTAAAVSSGVSDAGVRPLAEVVDPTKPFQLHVTKPGDSVSRIASSYGITTATLLDNNPTVPEDEALPLDMEIVVPRIDAIMHKASLGESVSDIVAQYDNIAVADVLAYRPNAIKTDEELDAGRFVLLPGATRKPPPPPPPPPQPVTPPPTAGGGGGSGVGAPPSSGGRFSLPLSRWRGVSDPFGVWRGVGRIHEGIDLDLYGYWNSPIYSSCNGVVSKVEYLTYSYGYHVIVDCGDGWSTLYAHMSSIQVNTGQRVVQGTQLGVSGVTGFTTGEHLHFEIRYFGAPVNPANYIDF